MSNIGFLFDLDGVLIDSESEYSKIWNKINQEYPSGTENLEQVIKGCTLDKILSDHYPEETVRRAVFNRLHELESMMNYEYLPGANEFLTELKNRDLPVALVTSSDETKMNHLKDQIPGIFDFFNFIVTADLVTESKPSPQGYHLAAGKINCDPKNCVVFEDSLQGVMAGHNSGSYVVGVYGTLPAETLSPYADEIIGSLSEINLDKLIEILTFR